MSPSLCAELIPRILADACRVVALAGHPQAKGESLRGPVRSRFDGADQSSPSSGGVAGLRFSKDTMIVHRTFRRSLVVELPGTVDHHAILVSIPHDEIARGRISLSDTPCRGRRAR